MEFLEIINETVDEFEAIARTLFDNYAIQTDNALYRFVEIEFYWNSTNHIDNSTYQRKHVDPKSGDWFFHFSGVDIALRNEQTGGYGGILIRKIYDINSEKIINGPMVCAMKLFSCTNAFKETIKTKIVSYGFSKSEIFKDNRIGLGKNAQENGADKLTYRFFIDPKK
ncbi:MAG: hypothetical protein EOO07_19800 [Chitinophagaceae bacterium]|nr:MAG: hypothetical protein EOO07_19800 [Chitinophagaceae bacterium]